MAVAANFRVEQYDTFLGTSLSAYQDYAAANEADYVANVETIDFTDDPSGFGGIFAGSQAWPGAVQTGQSGISAPVNDRFFARITASFTTTENAWYWFHTFNDDGVFLFVNDRLVINDPNLHSERRFLGFSFLEAGNHDIELFFFENGGAASLEFGFSQFGRRWSLTGGDDVTFAAVPLPAASLMLGTALLGGFAFARRKRV